MSPMVWLNKSGEVSHATKNLEILKFAQVTNIEYPFNSRFLCHLINSQQWNSETTLHNSSFTFSHLAYPLHSVNSVTQNEANRFTLRNSSEVDEGSNIRRLEFFNICCQNCVQLVIHPWAVSMSCRPRQSQKKADLKVVYILCNVCVRLCLHNCFQMSILYFYILLIKTHQIQVCDVWGLMGIMCLWDVVFVNPQPVGSMV